MLTVELKTAKNMDLSKSSLMDDENDLRRLRGFVEQQKRTIRKLTLKLSKAQQALNRERGQKGTNKKNSSGQCQNQQLLAILKVEVDRARQTEEILKNMVEKMQQLIIELHFESFIGQNSQTKDQNQHILTPSYKHFASFINLSLTTQQEMEESLDPQFAFRQLLLLQSGVRALSEKYNQVKNKSQWSIFQNKQAFEQLRKEKQMRAQVERQLQTETRTRIKLKRLLQKSECENNLLMMKIEQITLKQKEVSPKNHDEWVHLSKSLTLRISDLQQEKKQLHIECMREKQAWSEKYSELLKTVKSLQLTRR